MTAAGAATVGIRRGGLYLGRDVYDRFFAGLESVVLLRRQRDLCVLPVRHPAAGGYLLKRRNSAGDRVVNAPEFFRQNGIGDEIDAQLAALWSTELAALTVPLIFEPAN